MPSILKDKNIVLGVTGSIASYKAIDLASKLTQLEACVDVIMTQSATEFVKPLTFQSITHRSVISNIFDPASDMAINHVTLAERADVVIVAPATASTIAKIAHGISDDALGTTLLATGAPVIVAPAMDGNMFENLATQKNIATLIERNFFIAGPESGRLASGLTGTGRLLDTSKLVGAICMILGRSGDLTDSKILISAGGTQESIDPARIITNHSSGKMGYAIAEAARDRGAQVTLVTAPNHLEDIVGVNTIKVVSALDMQSNIESECIDADAIIMAAAVSDWRPENYSQEKLKKTESSKSSIDLIKNPDIISSINKAGLIKVGFAAETQDIEINAKKKIAAKKLDFVVANDITSETSGFSSDNNKVIIIHSDDTIERLPLMPKYDVGNAILDRVKKGLGNINST